MVVVTVFGVIYQVAVEVLVNGVALYLKKLPQSALREATPLAPNLVAITALRQSSELQRAVTRGMALMRTMIGIDAFVVQGELPSMD
jgi:hypothetical protein